MNKKCFRVIFSKTLQRLIVTSELAKAEGKAKESNSFSDLQIFARIRPLVFSLFCALGLVSTPTLAETLIIQADKTAPKHQQPIILQTANGLPQVNIQTPNDKGLSHNKYSKFDVDTKGAILNNSRTNVQTQQAGWVQGNPYLARGEAKVILNEVNSNDPSLLKGYVEVAGKKADVIIANPSGIHCQGCGIINSDRATFATGKPHIQNGSLESFVVEKGKVKVDGKGLDNSRVDYTEILAREVQANAGIWSKKETKVITGKNTVKRKDTSTDLQIIHSNQPLVDEAQPQFAVDVGELGGMYSGKIHLIGTEQGVGVRNAGHIGASSDTLQIDSKGRIVNTGTLNANQTINLTATKGIANTGKIENRQGDIQLNTNADIKQDGSIVSRQGNIQQHADTTISQQGETVAKGDVRYQAQTINASQDSLIAAGVTIQDNHNGEVRTLDTQSAQGRSLQVSATDQATLQGKNIASGTFNLHAGSVNVNHSQNSAHTIVIQGTTGNIEANSALFTAQADLQLKTPQALSTQSSHLTANNIRTEQASLNAKNATWKQTGTDDFHLKGNELITSGAAFSTQGDFKVEANQLDNAQGTLSSAKSLTLKVGKTLNSEGGQLLAGEDLHLTTSNLNNDGGLVYAKQNVEVVATESIRNQDTNSDNKGIVAGKALQLSTTTLSNQQGRVASVEGASITTKGLNNDGGKIATDSQLALNAVEISNNVGAVLAADKANLAFTTLSQKAGRIESVQLALTGNVLDSTEQSQILGEQVNIHLNERFAQRDSQLAASESLLLKSKHIDNQSSRIQSLNKLEVKANALRNQNGVISSAKDATFNVAQRLMQVAGNIGAAHLTLNVGELNSTAQSVISGGEVSISSLGQVNNQQSEISANNNLTIRSQAVDNQQGLLLAEQGRLQLDTHQYKLDNQAGKIIAGDSLQLETGEIGNQQGILQGKSSLHIDSHQQALDNHEGKVLTEGVLDLTIGQLLNIQGVIQSGQNSSIDTANQAVNNTGGKLLAQGDLKVNAALLENHQGGIEANNVTLDLSALHQTQGVIQARQNQQISTAAHLRSLNDSVIAAGQQLTLDAKGKVDNQQSQIRSGQQLTLSGKGIDNQQGEIFSETGSVNLHSQQQDFINQQGKVSAATQLVVKSGLLNNEQGLIQSGGDATLHTADLNNQHTQASQGEVKGILSLGQLTLNAVQLLNQQGYIGSQKAQTLALQQLNNQQGIISSQASQSLTIQDKVQNQAGRISGVGLSIVAKQLANNENGQILSKDALSLSVAESIDNAQGHIAATQAVTVTTKALNNPQGKLTSQADALEVNTQQALNNQQGVVAAQTSLKMTAAGLNNQAGKVQTAQGDMTLNIGQGALQNQQGTLNAGANLTLQGGSINNQQGLIFAHQDSHINVVQSVANTAQGKIQSLGALQLNAAQLDNQGGFIQSTQNMVLTAAQILNNRVAETGSRIESGAKLTLETADLANRNTVAQNQSPTQGIIAQQLVLQKASQLDNQQGGIYLGQRGEFNITQSLNNQQGEILSWGDIQLLGGKSLQIDNREGKLQAENRLDIQANQLSGDGVLQANHIDVNLQADFTAEQDINAKSTLSLATQGNLINRKKLSANDRLQLTAQDITNEQTGRISAAQTDLNAKATVTNEGLINSFSDDDNAKTVIKAQRIENIGTGRIYGDDVALGAEHILNQDKNGKSATIAARKRLDLAGKEIINDTQHYDPNLKTGSTIYSEGDIVFGRQLNPNNHAEGTAEVLRNKSSIIEVGGDIQLNVKDTFNTNEHFTTEMKEYPEEGNKENIEYILVNLQGDDLNSGFKVKGDRFNHKHLGDGVYDHVWNYGLARKLEDDELKAGYIPEMRKTCSSVDPNVCFYQPRVFYDNQYGIWKRFEITPPSDSFILPEHIPTLRAEPTKPRRRFLGGRRYAERLKAYEEDFKKYKQEVEAYNLAIKPYADWVEKHQDTFDNLNDAIKQHNRHYAYDLTERWGLRVSEKKVYKSEIKTSLPGQLLAGKDIHIQGNLENDKSTIISGQSISGAVKNKDEQGVRSEHLLGWKHWYDAEHHGGLRRKWKWLGSQEGPFTRIENGTFDMNLYTHLTHQVVDPITPTQPKESNLVNLTQLNDYVANKIERADVAHIDAVAFDSEASLKNLERHNSLISISRLTEASGADLAKLTHFTPSESSPDTKNEIDRLAQGDFEIRSVTVDTRLPNQGLYRINPAANSHFIVETDPDFTNQKRWLSSDYMFNALRYEPNATQKRLGDGFYEQRLVREQINRLTGRQFLGNYTDFDSQYRGLMDAGVSFAQKFNLQPGISLSPAQVAQLTSDIVWFESQSVTLPNGEVEQVLVPKVYALARKGDIDGKGTLISGNRVRLNATQLVNEGAIAGREFVQLNAESLKNSGKFSAGTLQANITGNAENIGGVLEADNALLLNIGGDFTHRSTTQTTNVDLAGYKRTDTTLDRKALLHVKGKNGALQLTANNINLTGADIINDGQGQTYISAKNNLNLKALEVGFDEKMGEGNHYRNEKVQDVVVSRIQGGGDVALKGHNILSEGSVLEAEKRLIALAENDLTLSSANRHSDYEEYHHTKSGSAFGSSKHTILDTKQQQLKQGSKLSGGEIILSAGNDVTAKNAQIIADNDITIAAGNNVSFSADTNYFKETHFEKKSKSGVLNGGNIGVTFGKKSQTLETEAEGWTQSDARGVLGSLNGNISVKAGNQATLLGSELVVQKTPDHSIVVEGKSATVEAGKDILTTKERREQKQSGLTIEFSSAVTDGAFAVKNAVKRSGQVKDDKLSALLKVKAANEAVETVEKARETIEALQNAANATEALNNSDFKIAVNVGSSKSVSTSNTEQITHQASELSGGRVIVKSTEGDTNIIGSKIDALEAELAGKNVNLLGVEDSQRNRSDNKNTGWKAGIFLGKSGDAKGFGIEGSAQIGKGHSNSDSIVNRHTEVNANKVNINATETTTVKGAVVNADYLQLETKNLHIESVQDSEKYDSKQTQAGVSASVAIYGSGSSVSAQASRSKANVDYAQVTTQSGFNIKQSSEINVTDNTHLKGGIINAEGESANHSLKTGTLTTEDIRNHSDIEVSSVSVGASTDMSQMAGQAISAALSALGNKSEHESSTTQSAISSNINVQITDNEEQKQKTGKTAEETLATLNRDVENANQKVEKQDLTKLQEQQEAAQIVAEIGAKRVGDLAKAMKWEDGSPEKVALHGLVGYLSAKVGGGNTAAGALSAMGSEYINTEIANYLKENTALTPDQRNAIQQLSAAGIGAVIGAGLGEDSNAVKQSAQMALRTEQFNRQLHPDEKQRIEELAQGDEEKQKRLEAAACALVHCSAQIPKDDPDYAEAYAKAKTLEDLGNQAEFASERALLSKQLAHYDPLDSVSGYRRQLFQYNEVQQGLDTVDRANTQYGVSTRVRGVAQAAGGVAATAFGVGLCESGIGCVAGVPVAAYGVDNAVAGARAVYSGKNHSTVGAKALSELTGMSPSTAEALYSAPSLIYGAKPIVSGLNTAGKVVAKETSQMANATKHMVGEVGKDIKGGIDVASNLAQHGYVNTAESIRYVTEKGIEKSMLSARKLSDSIENTGVRNFGLAATAGGVGTGVSESIDYFNGKEMTESNLLGSFRSIMINSGTAGISNNLSSLQNLGVNTVFGVTVQGKDLKQAIAESSIGIGTGKVIDRTSKNLDSGTRNVISTFSSEVINKSLNDNAKEKKGEGND